jgi:hypothetical protein
VTACCVNRRNGTIKERGVKEVVEASTAQEEEKGAKVLNQGVEAIRVSVAEATVCKSSMQKKGKKESAT